MTSRDATPVLIGPGSCSFCFGSGGGDAVLRRIPLDLQGTPAGTDENTGAAIPGENLEAGTATVNQIHRVFLPIVVNDYMP